MKPSNDHTWRFETLQLQGGQEAPDPAAGARAVPIYRTASYVFRDSAHASARFDRTGAGNIYGWLTNSTQEVLEKRLAVLEGGAPLFRDIQNTNLKLWPRHTGATGNRALAWIFPHTISRGTIP